MPVESSEILVAVGRVLLASLFVIGGARHFGMLDLIADLLRARGVPAARTVLIAASVFEIVAGILLAIGLLGPWPAMGLGVFTMAASVLMLNFWDLQGPERAAAINGFLANLALLGGLSLAAAASL